MNVQVLVPWLTGSSPIRERNLGFVLDLYRESLPDWPLRILTTAERPFSRGRVLNRGVSETEADVYVFNDADSLVDPAQIETAVAWAAAEPGFVFAYTIYGRLSRADTERIRHFDDTFDLPLEWELAEAGSQGCCAISRESFLHVGGFEQRFVGWGCEDLDFNRRASALWPLRRVPGDLNHLWHGDRRLDDSPLEVDPDDVKRNWQLWQELAGG